MTIGYNDDNQATVTILPGGELLAGLLFLGSGAQSASGFLTITGVTDETEPRPAAFRQSPMSGGSETYIGYDGYGEVTVAEGGVFSTRINYTAFNPGSTGKVTITGAGSVWDVNNVTLRVGQQGHGILHVLDGARVENFTNAFIGNIAVEDEVGQNIGGGSAELLIGGGASIMNSGYIRFGNHEGTSAEATVTGAGSAMLPGTYFQVGFNGSGSLLVTDGARVEVPLDGGSNSSIGRNESGVGYVTIEGEGSSIQVPRLIIGSDTNLVPTGFGTLLVRDNAELILGGLLGVRNGSTVELDNGTINLVGGVNPVWPDVIDIQGEGTRIFGNGAIKGTVLIGDGGTVTGVGAGIEIDGFLSGGGSVDNLTVGGVRVMPETGLLTLNNVVFRENGVVHVAITDFSDANNLLAYDSSTSLAGTHLLVSFSVLIDDPDWSAQILPAGVDHGFASITLPEGWAYDNGVLSVAGDGPPPPPPAVISNYTAATPDNNNWTNVGNWDSEFFPDAPNSVVQFGPLTIDTDRVNILFSSSLLASSGVLEVGSIRILPDFDSTAETFLIRNSSTGTAGTLKLYGYPETIGGQELNLLLGNFSNGSDIRLSPSNAGYVVELNGSGVFHNEGDALVRVSTEITEAGGPQSIMKTGGGILRFDRLAADRSSELSTYSGGFTLLEGIVEWTNSGGASANPFGIGPLTLKAGTLRSTTNTGRSLNTSIVLDGGGTIGSLEDGFLGNITVNSADGTLATTIVSDSILNMLSPSNWHQGTSGEGALVKTGPDDLVFTGSGGTVDHTGPTTVGEGLLRLNTDVNSSPITVLNGGRLGFGLSGETGRGVVNSSLTLEAGAGMLFRLDAPDIDNPENHDSLRVSGDLNLGGGELVIELGYTPGVNDTFLLIENVAWSAPNGLFSHGGVTLTEGSQFSVFSGEFSQLFEITYEGGSGFDVVITALGEAAAGPYQQWASGFGLSGADAGPDANPTGDGFSNAQKFAFGINPTVAVSALAQVSGDVETVTLRWNRSTNAGISYVIEFRESLTEGDWTEVPGAVATVMAEPDVTAPEGYERVEWSAEVDGGSGFYRARAVIGAALLP